MSRKFDCFMLHVGAGTNEKLAILTDSEYRAHISGVLAIAATAPVRGRLLVGEMEAEPIQVARKAGVTPQAAQSAMEKMQKVGVLYRDVELDCWAVHDWEKLNPEPKKDATAAERQRRYRARRRAQRDGDVTPDVTAESRRNGRDGHAAGDGPVTPPEVEEEEKTADAVSSGVVTPDPIVARLCQLHSDLCRARTDTPDTSRRLLPNKAWHRDMDRLMRLDGYTAEQVEYVIRWVDRDTFWAQNCLSVEALRRHFPTFAAKIRAAQQPPARPASPADAKNDARRARAAAALPTLMGSTAPADTIDGKEAAA